MNEERRKVDLSGRKYWLLFMYSPDEIFEMLAEELGGWLPSGGRDVVLRKIKQKFGHIHGMFMASTAFDEGDEERMLEEFDSISKHNSEYVIDLVKIVKHKGAR